MDAKPWPSLGGQVCAFIEQHLTFGPGDLVGQPATIDDEKRALIHRMYEVYPKGSQHAGRRRFKRVGLSLRKGSAKTELAAWIAICELHADGPVRCIGWDKKRQPIGGGVTDPYIPMVAYTEEQSEDLAYGAMRVILEGCDLGGDFDIGLERIMRRDGRGKAQALATAPGSRDGARTTFQHFDEGHLMVSPRLKKAYRAMLANIPKRIAADAWSLETTTAYAPGEHSVAEDTMDYARAVAQSRTKDPRLYFFHREASEDHDLTTAVGIRAAVVDASGPVAKWSDLDSIVEQWKDPTADKKYLERVWLNRLVKGSDRAFDVLAWRARARAGYVVKPGAMIALGFDGSRRQDATALVGTEIETAHQFVLGVWERPAVAEDDWEIPASEVDAAVADAFDRFQVWRMYADPPYWEEWVQVWSGRYGEERVVRWYTNQWRKMAYAVRAYDNAIRAHVESGKTKTSQADDMAEVHHEPLSHDGNPDMERHIANAHRMLLNYRDDKGERIWVIQKDSKMSPNKMDAAVAAVLSWQARGDAIALGVRPQPTQSYTVEALQ